MPRKTVATFLEQVARDEKLREQFARFAAVHGFDLTDLSEKDLEPAELLQPDSWFHTRAAERRSGEDRRREDTLVPYERRDSVGRRGRCPPSGTDQG